MRGEERGRVELGGAAVDRGACGEMGEVVVRQGSTMAGCKEGETVAENQEI